MTFKNPVALASGTCGFGKEFNEYFDIQKLGGLCSKGLTLNPCPGNDGIRVWETPSGVMNSVGMENPGVRHFIECDLERMNSLDLVNIVNLGGHSEEDYLEGVALLNEHELDLLELNISCPNTKAGCMSFGIQTETARDIVRKVRAVCKHKLVVKLSPNAENITALARACEEEGADGLSLTNTYQALAIDLKNAGRFSKMSMLDCPVQLLNPSLCAWSIRWPTQYPSRLWGSAVLPLGGMRLSLSWQGQRWCRSVRPPLWTQLRHWM